MASTTPDPYGFSTNITNKINDVNMTHQEIQEYLQHLEDEEFHVYVPAIVYIIFISVVGFFGNILVLLVYKLKFPKTPTRIFIMTIAIFDLFTNIVSVPGDITKIIHQWTYSSPVLCHGLGYAMTWTVVSSTNILLPLCITRYLKICRPFGKQVTPRHAKIISCLMVLVAALCSTPYGVIHGISTRPTPRPGIYGFKCQIDDAYVGTMWPAVIHCFYLIIFISACIPMIILYSLIGVKAFKLREVPGRSVIALKIEPDTSKSEEHEYKHSVCAMGDITSNGLTESSSSTSISSEEQCVNNDSKRTQAASNNNLNCKEDFKKVPANTNQLIKSVTQANHSANTQARSREKHDAKGDSKTKTQRNKSRTTIILVLITSVFILTFLPFLAVSFYRYALPDDFKAMGVHAKRSYYLFRHSYLVSSAANVIIYSLCDPRFRQEAWILIHGKK